MATTLHSDSRRLYSWWWDSHISPKNSKWLQENLTDMDAKVKAMIKLIEEDADSFARRAEMYYKKRPELMKLVEEFYRAYRALAERYDHATVELRHAHKTMAEAFPNQMAYEFADDSPSGSSVSEAEPHTPEMPHPLRAFSDSDDLQKYAIGLSSSSLHSVKKSGLEESDYRVIKRSLNSSHPREGYGRKGLNYHDSEEKEHSPHDGFSQLSYENQKLKTQVHSESERASKAEDEVQSLKEILAKMRSEKEAVLILYQQSLEKLSNLEREFICAQKEAREFDERASKAETEIKVLGDTLRTLKAERDAGLLRYKQCSERISELEAMISLAEQDAKGLSQRAIGAETEAQKLKQELSRVEGEKEAGLLQYKACLKKISDMENEILLAGEHAKMLTERTDRAETEVKKLRLVLDRSNEEKEAVALQYKECLDKIARLENEISRAQEDAGRLNNEILMGATKLKSTEEQVVLLDRLNQSLRLEADNLVQKMVMTDQELLNKKEELGKLQIHLQDEHSRFLQVEASLLTSQKLHTQYQEEQRTLALELRNGLLMLKDLDVSKHGMEEEIRHVKEENQCLNELKLSSDTTLTNQQNEITSLREMKEKLEQEVARQVDQSNVLEGEICSLKGEIKDLNQIYQAIMDQIQSVGLQPQSLGESVKELQVENSKLKEICKKEQVENEALSKKLVNIEKLLGKNSILEASLSDTREELLMSKEKLKALQESVQFLQGERSSLVAEKAIIFSQLQLVTETMRKLFEKNTTLENSLAGANAELEGLRAKSKSLEEICQWHSSEKSNLHAERSSLVLQLESVEGRLRKLENRFAELEEKYAGLDKEKKSTLCQVEELQVSLDVEKQEHAKFTKSSDTRLAALENNVCLLQKGSTLCKEDFEEELDKAVNEQVEIFILQKFIEDLEEKNFTLLIECQKHVEASKLSDKLIAELESENLEQQMEAEFFLDQIEWLRKGISRVFKALQIAPLVRYDNKIEQEHAFLPLILERIGSMKYCAEEIEDERQQLLVENMVLTTLLEQLKSEGIELESEKKTLDQQFNALKEQFQMLQNKNDELLEMNMQLSLKVREGDQQGEVLEADKKILQLKLEDFQGSNFELQEQNSRVLEENISLLKECSDLEEKKCMLEDENGVILDEAMVFSNLSLIFKSYWTEKAFEQKALAEDLDSVHGINIDFKRKVGVLHEKLELKEAENLHLKESFEKINTELHEVRDMSDQLKYQTSIGKESLIKKETELSVAEQELRATHNLNTELCRTVEVLKKESEESKLMGDYLEKQIVELSKDNNYLTKEIECLREVNGRLESELDELHEEVEERRSREENLSSDLQERSKEFELWEAEAMTFYFDLQISSIHEVLLEDKVHELTGVCENLEQEKASKDMEIEKMKEKVSFVESEIGGLKAQLSAYVPVVDSLSDDIASLEQNANFQRKIELRAIHGSKDMEVVLDSYEKNCVEQPENESTVKPDGISALQKMQSRIKSVEKAVVQQMEMLAMEKALNANIKVEAAKKETEELKSRSSKREKGIQKVRNEISDHLQRQKIDPEIFDETDGILMKDIPLDQNSDSSFSGTIRRENGGADEMLELWETAEQNFMPNARVKQLKKKASASVKENFVSHQVDTEKKRADLSSELQVEKELGIDKLEASIRTREPSKEVNKRKILERLASDAQKMISIQVTVQGLMRKMEANNNTKKSKDVEYGTTKEHLQEVEEAVVQLMDMNSQLIKNIEESPSFSDGNAYAESEEARNVERKRVLEQARKGSEKIVQLQLEMQKIQYALLKLEGKKESNLRSKFPKGTTSIVLKNFIYSSPRSSRRRKKPRFCGCLRPSTTETLASP